MKMWVYVVAVIGMACLGAFGQVFFKIGSGLINPNHLKTFFNWGIIIGLFFYGIATFGYILALRKMELTMAYPLISFSYLFVLVLGAIFLKETLSYYNIFGAILLLASVYLMVK